MQKKAIIDTVLIVLATALLTSACGTLDKIAPGRKIDYKKSNTTDALEIPPDLSSSTIKDAPSALEAAGATYSGLDASEPVAGKAAVLPGQSNIRVERDGDQQWLVIQDKPEKVWPRVREFWMEQGFLINKEDPRVGVIETGWAENRADIPAGPIRGMLSKVIDSAYSAATRDQFRVRLEHGAAADTTELYLTHRGVEEVVQGSTDGDGSTIWRPRPSDPELEAEMLKHLMVYLGVEDNKAKTLLANEPTDRARARLVKEASGSMLLVEDGFSRAWRRTGIALDRVGFAVEDRDRAEGIYYVRYSDPLHNQNKKGLLSKLAFWSTDEAADATQYQITLVGQGANTQVTVRNAQGDREASATGERILKLLEEQLR